MIGFFQEIFTLLTSSPGNLAYHLVIAFSIAGALASAFGNWRQNEFPQGRRMVLGLSALLFLRVVLFVFAALAWQGLINEQALMPAVDRTVSLISVIIIVWLWVFPEPQRMADAATVLLIFLAFTLLAFNLVWWSNLAADIDYNGTLPDAIYQLSILAVTALGLLGLVLRRPNSWGIGMAMLGLIFLGHSIYLLFPYPQGDYPGVVRLVEMTAYPLLLALPHRFPERSLVPPPIIEERKRYSLHPEILDSYLDLGVETPPGNRCLAIVKAVSYTYLADICLLVSPPDVQDYMAIQCGYDLIREKPIEGVGIASQDIALISAALRKSRPLRLPASSTSSDLLSLGNILNLDKCGHLLVVPVTAEDGNVIAGIILLSPYSNRSWSTEDQSNLMSSANSMAQLLQHTHAIKLFEEQLSRARQDLQAAQAEAQRITQENLALQNEIKVISELRENNRTQVESLEALLMAHEEAQAIIAQLQSEVNQLQQADLEQIDPVKAIALGAVMTGELSADTNEKIELEEELRIALKEIAHLQTVLSDADRKILELERQMLAGTQTIENWETITSLAQDLRQPLSSILGYTDFLLAETVGILGNLQRKFLERVKVSSARMSKLVDELIYLTSTELTPTSSASSIVDINEVVDEAVAQISDQLRTRDIALRVDLQSRLPGLDFEKGLLEETLVTLLENAGTVTPEEGEIALRARVENDGRTGSYILIQVADQGGGIDSEELSKVLSNPEQIEDHAISGIGEALIKLPYLRSRIEALDGRIWIDSEPGTGSIFSLLLPVKSDIGSIEDSGDLAT